MLLVEVVASAAAALEAEFGAAVGSADVGVMVEVTLTTVVEEGSATAVVGRAVAAEAAETWAATAAEKTPVIPVNLQCSRSKREWLDIVMRKREYG